MENILEQIVSCKRSTVAGRKKARPVSRLERSPYLDAPVHSLAAHLKDRSGSGIIAEFKRRSPSGGMLNMHAEVGTVTEAYTKHGATALSVLTEEDFFGGSTYDLRMARQNEGIPLLRKDFIIEEYQVWEARALGADAILLIAAILSPRAVQRLAGLARSLQMEVILELHAPEELDCLCPDVSVAGINNRDLKSFTTDLRHSLDMLPLLPPELPKISESGIRAPEDVQRLREAGFDGFLIGSLFMREPDPGAAFASFAEKIRS